MKINIFTLLMSFIFFTFLLSGCVQEGKVGPKGDPGQANIYYSGWNSPTSWAGNTNDWYFDVSSSDISEDVVESGIILAYMSVPGDIYQSAVRPMPAWALGSNWDFLIPEYGQIEFTCDSELAPGTENYYFRFVVIPSGSALKSTKTPNITKDELLKMPYTDVCKLLCIPE